MISRVVCPLLAEDPSVGFIESQLYERDVVAVESRGFVPDVALLKQTDDGDGVADAGGLFAYARCGLGSGLCEIHELVALPLGLPLYRSSWELFDVAWFMWLGLRVRRL